MRRVLCQGSGLVSRPSTFSNIIVRNLFKVVAKKEPAKEPTRNRLRLKARDNRPIIQSQRARNAQLEEAATTAGLGWRTVVSTIVQRYTVVAPDYEPWEADMRNLQEKIATKKRELLMDAVSGTNANIIPEKDPSVEDIVKSLPFTPAPLITEADKKNDRKSLDRKLREPLFLIVKRNRQDNAWQFPQGRVLETEDALRKTAERVSDRATGRIRRYFLSNAPMGHYCYPYPKELQEKRQQFGAKVYFYRCQYLGGDIRLETKLYKDHAWITRGEVGEYFDKELAAFLTEMLPIM